MAPSPGLRIRTRTLAVVVIAIVILVTLAGMFAAGIGPFQRSLSHLTGPITYSQARSIADPTAQGYSSGGWTLIGAGAVDLPHASTVPISAGRGTNLSSYGNCSVRLVTTATTLTVPAFHGSASAGTSPAWGMAYRNASGGLLVVGVFNGSGEALAVMPGGTICSTAFSLIAPLSGIVDSPEAASHVAMAGGSTFLTQHPNATMTMSVVGGFSFLGFSVPTVWSVNYTACGSVASIGQLMPTFNATVDAVTGQVTFTHSGMTNCTAVQGTGGLGLIVLTSANSPTSSPTASPFAWVRP